MSKAITVAIIDYGINNLFSIDNALRKIGVSTIITNEKDLILAADAIVLPGVGAFERAMSALQSNGLVQIIESFIKQDKYVLGICLGMQLLMETSEEFGIHQGIGFIQGTCKKFDQTSVKVPHINWSGIRPFKSSLFPNNSPLIENNPNDNMYFIHSYYVLPKNENDILSITEYNSIQFCSAIQKGKIIGLQFHPEKSGIKGLNILKNFKQLIENDKK